MFLRLGRWLLGFTISLVVFTFLGQIQIAGVTLEQRYHEFVNSESFQSVSETVFSPFELGKEKLGSLMRNERFEKAKDSLSELGEVITPQNLDPRKLEQIRRDMEERNKALKDTNDSLDSDLPENSQ